MIGLDSFTESVYTPLLDHTGESLSWLGSDDMPFVPNVILVGPEGWAFRSGWNLTLGTASTNQSFAIAVATIPDASYRIDFIVRYLGAYELGVGWDKPESETEEINPEYRRFYGISQAADGWYINGSGVNNSSESGNFSTIRVYGRLDVGTASAYFGEVSSYGEIRLCKLVGETVTVLGTARVTLGDGAITCYLEMIGSALRFSVGGTEITATDSSLSAKGDVAIGFLGGASPSRGLVLDQLSVEDVTVTATTIGTPVLSGYANGSTISLSWTEAENATTYQLYQGTDVDAIAEQGDPTASRTATLENMKSGNYYFEVAGIAGTQFGPRSNQLKITVLSSTEGEIVPPYVFQEREIIIAVQAITPRQLLLGEMCEWTREWYAGGYHRRVAGMTLGFDSIRFGRKTERIERFWDRWEKRR